MSEPQRPRANTASFPHLPWRRQTRPPRPPTPSHDLHALLDALTPPAVPSLSHARQLAAALATASPLPRRPLLNPVLTVLCAPHSPLSVQSAGYDVLAAYCENNEAPALTTADRLAYFSLFQAEPRSWAVDLWEPRFKALRALTKYGQDVIGIELGFIAVLQAWIDAAFDGMLANPDAVDRLERERSIDILATFLAAVLTIPEIVARIPDHDLAAVLAFYAALVDRAILLLVKTNHPKHRRNHSSLSNIDPPPKHPADMAVSLYLDHLDSQLKSLAPSYLDDVLPLLLRALALTSSPLPRLSVLPHPTKKPTSEDKITETLHKLFAGPYSTKCILVLKTLLFPSSDPTSIHTSLGAHRTFRNYVRRALSTRLARAYISRESSVGYSPSGAPGHLDLERGLLERAWPKDDYTSALGHGKNGWDAGRLGKVLTRSVEAWVAHECEGKEDILDEAAGVLKDIWAEFDGRGDDEKNGLDEEEACVVGETLEQLVKYVLPLKNRDGTPFILPLSTTSPLPLPFLRSLSLLLSRDHTVPTSPLLSTILLQLSPALTDTATAPLPLVMFEQHDLSPTSPSWLLHWQTLLDVVGPYRSQRPLTRKGAMDALKDVYESVRDMRAYRVPLAEMVRDFCQGSLEAKGEGDQVAWKILGEEIVLKTVEWSGKTDEDPSVNKFVDLLVAAASEEDYEPDEADDQGDASSILTTDTPSPPLPQSSPTLSRSHSEHPAKEIQRERGDSSGILSIISSLTTGHSSRSHSISRRQQQPPPVDDVPYDPSHPPTLPPTPSPSFSPPSLPPSTPRNVAAVSALICIFSQLTFTPPAPGTPAIVPLALRVYALVLHLLKESRSTRVRLAALQFLMRLRADRDHRLYFTTETPSHVTMLASLINRLSGGQRSEATPETGESSRTRTRERDGRQLSRGRANAAGRPSRTTTASRSRSRAATTLPRTPIVKPSVPLWHMPETYPFDVAEVRPSEELISYDPDSPLLKPVLPISHYLAAIICILEKETNWEVLSYVLCHLPVQLGNKHLFCGPMAREAMAKMLGVISTGILNGEMAVHLTDQTVKPRDAQGLAFHTLQVLISYKRCFELKQCHLLVEVFQTGLSFGQFATIKCCLHALSLAAVELQSSMTKCLPRILEMLSQIMSGTNMAVHILGFLFLIGALPPLYANFTENDYKMVFGVALQYLQHYNLAGAEDEVSQSWALSQHVRILSYTVVYGWFLALKQPDRPRHIPYITRQLLLANEGNEGVDDPTEVCFDWLARYTYASADPRPAPSVFNDIVMNPPAETKALAVIKEKTWVYGHALITIRTLAKRGWIEVLSRRPSGFAKFLCRAENAPLVGAGDVDPDFFTLPATLMMERNPAKAISSDRQEPVLTHDGPKTPEEEVREIFAKPEDEELDTPHPNPVTGYVWSGTAPSQRRKEVSVDPSYFAIQLSAYPHRAGPSHLRTIVDPKVVQKYVGMLDLIPVIDTHKVGIMYVAPGQTDEAEILQNTHGSPAYTRFLEGLGRLVKLRDQLDVYAGGLDPNEDGEFAYAWWDDIGQVLYHTATMMPTTERDPQCTNKKRHIGNDYVRIVWNDSGVPYRFDTLATQFQFVNIVIEPHSLGAIAAFSNNIHENEYFKITVQRAPGMTEFAPIGHFKIISAEALPLFVRQLSRLADWFASVFAHTQNDTVRVEMKTNWRMRLESIRRFKNQIPAPPDAPHDTEGGIMSLESARDFTTTY